MNASKSVRPLSDLLVVLIAPALWFGHFSLLYAAETLVCAGALNDRSAAMNWAASVTTAAASTGLLVLAIGLHGYRKNPFRRDGNCWLRRTALLTTLLSALGVLWTAFPTLILPACELGAASK